MAAYKDVYSAQYAGCTLVQKSILPYYLIQPADFSERDLNGAEFRRAVAAVDAALVAPDPPFITCR